MTKKIEATYGYLYHFAFVPRRKLLREFQQHKESIGKILTRMCGYLKVGQASKSEFSNSARHLLFLSPRGDVEGGDLGCFFAFLGSHFSAKFFHF